MPSEYEDDHDDSGGNHIHHGEDDGASNGDGDHNNLGDNDVEEGNSSDSTQLTCVGRDANDQMYPVAWAVVQVENNDTWSWFLKLLIEDLEMIDGGKGWTLITDQQKGFVPAIAELLPNSEHRMCARHVFSNCHKVFKGGNLRMLFWQIAKSSTMEEMNKNFERLKAIDEAAYEDLKKRGVEH